MRSFPSPAPAPSPSPASDTTSPLAAQAPPHAPLRLDLSPPLLAMLAVIGAALLVVFYTHFIDRLRRRWHRWRRHRRLVLLQSSFSGNLDPSFSPGQFGANGVSFGSSDDGYCYFNLGLTDSAIKNLPLHLYTRRSVAARDCAVCLVEFDDGDALRGLPVCAHVFHAECIAVWLRAHASCPLCRAAVIAASPLRATLRSARIRPSLDDDDIFLAINSTAGGNDSSSVAAALEAPREFLLKRSYSFGFERSLATEAATASPWRYRSGGQRGGGFFFSKRWHSPFNGAGGASAPRASRVFSFRSARSNYNNSSSFYKQQQYSPFARRRGFFSLSSEPRPSIPRRSGSMAEALVSPERLGGRR